MNTEQPHRPLAALLVDNRQQAAILASLRHTQDVLRNGQPLKAELHDIATNAGEFEPLSVDEIDELCELINFDTPLTQLQAIVPE